MGLGEGCTDSLTCEPFVLLRKARGEHLTSFFIFSPYRNCIIIFTDEPTQLGRCLFSVARGLPWFLSEYTCSHVTHNPHPVRGCAVCCGNYHNCRPLFAVVTRCARAGGNMIRFHRVTDAVHDSATRARPRMDDGKARFRVGAETQSAGVAFPSESTGKMRNRKWPCGRGRQPEYASLEAGKLPWIRTQFCP